MAEVLRTIQLIDFSYKTIQEQLRVRRDLNLFVDNDNRINIAFFYDPKTETIYFFDEDAPINSLYIEHDIYCPDNRHFTETCIKLYNCLIWLIYTRVGWENALDTHLLDPKKDPRWL